MQKRFFPWFFLLILLCAVLLYLLFGHLLIQAMYDGKSLPFLNQIIEGRGTVPLEHYLEYANQWVWTVFALGAILFLALGLRIAGGVTLFLISFFSLTLFLFSLLEIFPSLASLLHLNRLPYYAYRTTIISDEKLVFRNRPFHHMKFSHYRGELYSSSYGVEVTPILYETFKDKDGFNNSIDRAAADMVVLGDSYIEYGADKEDAFSRRLEQASGLSALNLGVGNYGPSQYLEIFKQYGLGKKSRVALFCFFAGNDLLDIAEYEKWVKGDNYYRVLPPRNFFRRYLLVMAQIAQFARNSFYPKEKRFDLIDLKLKEEHRKVVFGYLNDTHSPEEIAASAEWQKLANILKEFKSLSLENHIFPVVIYIPTVAQIYAQYSTEQSDPGWLQMKDQQIAAKSNLEQTLLSLSQKIGVELVSLSPVFELAAKEGKELYYPFDTHWNSEGREVAARFVAERLKELQRF